MRLVLSKMMIGGGDNEGGDGSGCGYDDKGGDYGSYMMAGKVEKEVAKVFLVKMVTGVGLRLRLYLRWDFGMVEEVMM